MDVIVLYMLYRLHSLEKYQITTMLYYLISKTDNGIAHMPNFSLRLRALPPTYTFWLGSYIIPFNPGFKRQLVPVIPISWPCMHAELQSSDSRPFVEMKLSLLSSCHAMSTGK